MPDPHTMRAELDPAGDNLDLRSLLQGLARSSRWIVALVLLGSLVGLGYGLVRPNQYVSEGKIEVRLGIRERRTPESSLDPTNDAPAPVPGIGDEIELLYNPEVYERIARQIGLERLLAPYDPSASDAGTTLPTRWLHVLQSWWFRRQALVLAPEQALLEAATMADEAIEVVALNNTSYLLVRSTALTPELAQLLTRTYVAVARQWHREVYSSSTELSFVSDQLKRYEEESLAAERTYTEHRDRCGFYDLETQKGSSVAALVEKDERIQENTIRLFEVEEELAFVERELAATPATIEKLVPPSVRVNPEHQTAFDQIQRVTGERTALASVYTEGSETFQRKAEQLDAEIRRCESLLNRTPEYIEYGVVTREVSPNPRHEELSIRKNELRREQQTRGKTLEMWQRSREEQDGRLRAALQCEPLHRDLALAVERSKARVQELAAALERAQALALLDRQEDMDSLRIALDGSLPREKAGPDRKRFLLLGFFGGLAAGMFLAALRFLLDTRLHDPDALSKELGLEVIGVVPEARAARMESARSGRRAAEAGA
ncbi:MAG: hypothetical protein HOP15_09010 [Planctomycetes bacterium]|nr:hypothetical protein [Planctomycetota bacterium]